MYYFYIYIFFLKRDTPLKLRILLKDYYLNSINFYAKLHTPYPVGGKGVWMIYQLLAKLILTPLPPTGYGVWISFATDNKPMKVVHNYVFYPNGILIV